MQKRLPSRLSSVHSLSPVLLFESRLSGKESAMQETPVRSLGGEDPLGKEMATHSSIRAWEIPWTEKPGGLQSRGSQKSGTRLSN